MLSPEVVNSVPVTGMTLNNFHALLCYAESFTHTELYDLCHAMFGVIHCTVVNTCYISWNVWAPYGLRGDIAYTFFFTHLLPCSFT